MPKLILIADDSEEDAESIQRVLSAARVGNPVWVIADSSDLIAYLSGEGIFADRFLFPLPGVLFLDLKMPGINGFEVLEWLQQRPGFRELLVVVLSGLDGIREINRAYELGANSFLVKPCKPGDLRNLMKSFPEYWIPVPALAVASLV